MRREFIKKIFKDTIGVFALGIVDFGCQSDKTKSLDGDLSGTTSCDDLSGISKEEIRKREGLAYIEHSVIPYESCSNCRLYIPPKENENCGGCALFAGPVFESGYCVYWASKI